jgi:hypothetical protein
MNETLEPYVKKLLDGGMKTAEEVLRFVETQAPLLGEEIILWGAVSEIVGPIVGLSVVIVMLVLHFKVKDNEEYYGVGYGAPPCFFVFGAMFMGFGMFVHEIMDVLYPLIAPKLFLLDKISSFIK